MSKKYFEFYVNNKHLNSLSEHFLECMLGEKGIQIQKNTNLFQNSNLVTIFKDNDHLLIEEKNIMDIKDTLEKLKKGDVLISCDSHYSEYIELLFKYNTVKIKKINNMIYYNSSKFKDFLHLFFEKFNIKIIKSKFNLQFYLNLRKLYFPSINFNKNPDCLIRQIYDNGGNSDFYENTGSLVLENLKNLEEGKLLKYYYFQETLKSKYILLKNLMEINQKYNLPTNYVKKMIKNLELDNCIETFNYYYYKLLGKSDKVPAFNFRSFENIEDAISYQLDLEDLNVRGILIKYDNKLNICYDDNYSFPYKDNKQENKIRLVRKLELLTSKDYMFEEYTLEELINIQVKDNIPYLEKNKNVPIDLRINKGMNIYNLKGSLLDFGNNKYPKFDRKNFDISDKFQIEIIKKIKNYNNILVTFDDNNIVFKRDFYVPDDNNTFKTMVETLLKKGYLLSDVGIIRYKTENKILSCDIIEPDWLIIKNSKDFGRISDFVKTLS